ncbi:four-helix bundle copper-binding protein [Bdellovibrio reynosensis]|uniref:Four-helix bundle copper-binding protein n=1 Tax=Bdellovibrio reynosensis TaxID=2835041 RepID=A0ABY4CC65_9BACT|nr:four-helix bundle copper-binding protein [Bdellovibrio reynosensis]UOF01261.1 four-helix bundle copper-binding protein [Bdellovibrio reynosensis]
MGNRSSQVQGRQVRTEEMASTIMQECIKNCMECFQTCTSLVQHCLGMGGEHAEPFHIGVLQACSYVCETSSKLMLINSEFHSDMCRICADICIACAVDCEKLGPNDPMMKHCAEVCRRCAESCSKMAAH